MHTPLSRNLCNARRGVLPLSRQLARRKAFSKARFQSTPNFRTWRSISPVQMHRTLTKSGAFSCTAPPPTCSVPVVPGGTTYYSSTAPITPAASAMPTVPVSHAAHVQIPDATRDYADDWCHPSTRPFSGILFQDLIEVMKISRKGPLPE